MGTMKFQLPAGPFPDRVRDLERASVSGGPDNMPWPTQAWVDGDQLNILRDVDESGCLTVPWEVEGTGRVLTSSGTLMEREGPYSFLLELARGKVNQLRSQAFEWQTVGLQMPADLAQQLHEVNVLFARATTRMPAADALSLAQNALNLSCQTAERLVGVYVDQLFHVRHQRQAQFDTTLACRLQPVVPQGAVAEAVPACCNAVCLPLSWKDIEPSESQYAWEPQEALLAWAESQGLSVVAGPLVDFGPGQLPSWLELWNHDLHSIAHIMCDYVGTVVKRFHDRIHCWQLTSASNCANVLGLGEDEILWLTVRLAEAARQVDSGVELVIGVSQPWGDYMAQEERSHSPFIFADTLIRAGLNLAAVDLEWVMGVTPHGSYCRDLLEASRLLDLYALLGVPLQVTLGYPSSAEPDRSASPSLRVDAGHWHSGLRPEVQAEWATSFGALALCKPYVRGISWAHLSDAEPHQFPHCGLVDSGGAIKPAMAQLRELRAKHLH
jgi:hypothetical protein